MSIFDEKRNPLLLPDVEGAKPYACEKCGSPKYRGRRITGVLYKICLECGFVAQGGLPREPVDPLKPLPPQDPRDRPLVDFVKNSAGQLEELRRRPDPRPDYRRGAPLPEPGEDL
jgi:hypothetical protein